VFGLVLVFSWVSKLDVGILARKSGFPMQYSYHSTHNLSFKTTISEDLLAENMNIDLVQEYSRGPVSAPEYQQRVSPLSKSDFVGRLIPQLQHGRGPLSSIPQETLRENLYPIILALQRLDAELLLGLERTARGPRVQAG
jgi:hypothetical protein